MSADHRPRTPTEQSRSATTEPAQLVVRALVLFYVFVDSEDGTEHVV